MSGPKSSFQEIPVIDLALGDDPTSLPTLLSALRIALTEVGFLYISNHKVPQQALDSLVDILPRLFALPDSAKNAAALENSKHFLGYSGAGTEITNGQADVREQIEFATELTAISDPDAPLYEGLRGPNQVCSNNVDRTNNCQRLTWHLCRSGLLDSRSCDQSWRIIYRN